MTHEESKEYIGRTGEIKVESMTIPVKVLDVKTSYGNDRFLISPELGFGQQWVSIDRVKFA